jgi:hypothetical protein
VTVQSSCTHPAATYRGVFNRKSPKPCRQTVAIGDSGVKFHVVAFIGSGNKLAMFAGIGATLAVSSPGMLLPKTFSVGKYRYSPPSLRSCLPPAVYDTVKLSWKEYVVW